MMILTLGIEHIYLSIFMLENCYNLLIVKLMLFWARLYNPKALGSRWEERWDINC